MDDLDYWFKYRLVQKLNAPCVFNFATILTVHAASNLENSINREVMPTTIQDASLTTRVTKSRSIYSNYLATKTRFDKGLSNTPPRIIAGIGANTALSVGIISVTVAEQGAVITANATPGATFVLIGDGSNTGGGGSSSGYAGDGEFTFIADVNTTSNGINGPTSVSASIVAGVQSISVAWTAPSIGSSTITGYEYTTDGVDYKSLVTSGTTGTITTLSVSPYAVLVDNTRYTLYIRAISASGPGTPSDPFEAVLFTTVSAPVLSSVTRGDTFLVLAWVAPTTVPGGGLSDYDYTTDNGITWKALSSTSTSATIYGDSANNPLATGATYKIRVRARYSGSPGYGPPSNDRKGVLLDV